MLNEQIPELEQAFTPYRAEVWKLWLKRALLGHDATRMSECIARGGEFDVFRMNDPGLVAKLPYESKARETRPRQALQESMAALVIGQGIKRAEQVRAYSAGLVLAVLCDYVPGTMLEDIPEAEREQFSDTHYAGLLDTLQEMEGKTSKKNTPVCTALSRYMRGSIGT